MNTQRLGPTREFLKGIGDFNFGEIHTCRPAPSYCNGSHKIGNITIVRTTSSTRTRRGGSCLKDIYKRPFSSIELACAVRQPSPCVRALCESGVLFHMSHLKLHFALHTSHCTLHTPHCTLHTSHSTLLTSHCTLPNPHFTLHCTLPTAHSTLHTPHFTLHTPHFTLHSSRPTLHTALFTLHTSSHLSSSHLIPAHLFSSHLFSYVI